MPCQRRRRLRPGADGRRVDLWRRRAIRSIRRSSEGRPNGMPAFGTRIPKDQIWQLAAYVRSTAGLAPQDGAPNRDDAFLTRVPESFMDPQKPATRRAVVGQRTRAVNGIHDVRVPVGPQAAALFDLWNVMLVACAVVFVLIVGALRVLRVACAARHRARGARPRRASADRREAAALRAGRGRSVVCCAVRASGGELSHRPCDRDIAAARRRADRSHRPSVLVGGPLRSERTPRWPLPPPTSCTCRWDGR